MTKQIVLRAPQSFGDRRQPLLGAQDNSSRGGSRVAEVLGGTTAECAAVCCCCPCGIVNLLVLAVYKVPAGLCRKALRRKRRRKMIRKGVLPTRKCGCGDIEFYQLHPLTASPMTSSASSTAAKMMAVAAVDTLSMDSDEDVMELEKEMWDKFCSAGFWRRE